MRSPLTGAAALLLDAALGHTPTPHKPVRRRRARHLHSIHTATRPIRTRRAQTRMHARCCDGATPTARPAACARRQRAVRHRVWQRRVVDLLRAGLGRRPRPRADAARLRHHGDLLLLHGGDLRRGDGDVPRGRRVVELRAPRLQRARLVLRGLGADAQLRHHGRDLGLLRAALPRRPVLGTAALRAGRRDLRRRRDHRAVAHQRRRDQGVGGPEHRPRGRGLLHPAAHGRRRRAARLLAADAGRQHQLRRRPDLDGLPAGDPAGDDRLHRNRDDLEHGRGGQGRGGHDPQGDRPRAHSGLCDLLHAPARRAVRAAGHPRSADGRAQHAARRRRGGRRIRGRPDPRRRQAARPRHPAAARRALRRPARRDDPAHRDERRHHRRVTPRVLDGDPPPGPRPPAPAAPEVQHALDRDPRVRRRRLPHAAARTGRVPRQHVRLRRDAVVHDRPRGGHPAAPRRAGARASLPRSRHAADRRPRAAGLRRVRRPRRPGCPSSS